MIGRIQIITSRMICINRFFTFLNILLLKHYAYFNLFSCKHPTLNTLD